MTSPTPSLAQPVVLEALRLARDALLTFREHSMAWGGREENALKAANAALVQPPEAPAVNTVVSVNSIPTCAHTNERTSTGPTTSQINHFCPGCKQSWVTFPAAVEVSRLAGEHRPVSADEAAKVDALIGLRELPPIRLTVEEVEALNERAVGRGIIVQAHVRDLLRESLATMAPTPASDSAAETALRMAVERHMTCRFYFGSTVAQATVPGGPAVYETVENHADPLIGACQAIAQAAAKIDAGTPAPQVPLEAARQTSGVHDFAGQPSVEESLAALVVDQQSRGAARLVGGEAAAALISEMRLQVSHLVDDLCESITDEYGMQRYVPRQTLMFHNMVAALVHWSERAATQAAPTDAPGEPDDMLTVAHVTTDGGGILTMLASSLGDLIDIVGDEPETYSVSIGNMKRAAFEAMGEFDGF